MAKTLNLDRSERVDVTCKKGDTFLLNLLLKDEDGNVIDLTDPLSTFTLQVRAQDDYDDVGEYTEGSVDGYVLSLTGTNSTETTGLVTFSGTPTQMKELSGLYVYDIQRSIGSVVETLVYGVFKVNEDVTVLS